MMRHLVPFRVYESQTSSGLTPEQEDFLNRYTKGTWSVNPTTGLVDIQGNFDYVNRGARSFFGVKFGNVTGSFFCNYNELQSLAGAPKQINGEFQCDQFELDSGEWNMDGWVEVLRTGNKEEKKLILTLPISNPTYWNSKISENPESAIIKLSEFWDDLPDNIRNSIRIPSDLRDDFDNLLELVRSGII